MSVLLVVAMYALWSTVFSLGKLTLFHCPPLFLTATRMLLAGFLLLSFVAIRRKGAFRLSGKQFLSLTLLGIFSIYFANAFEFWSLQHLSAAKTCFIYSLSPFFAALFSYLHFGETMNGRKWLGLGVGFAGVIPVLAGAKGSEELLSSFPLLSWPELAMVGAALSAVYGWTLMRVLVKDSEISPVMANGSSMVIGGGLAALHSWLVEGWTPFPVQGHDVAPFVQGVALMTLISNVVCYNLYGFLLKRFTSTFLSFIGLLSPIFASLSSWLLLGEPPSPLLLSSTGIVLLGLWLVYSAELKQGYIQKKPEPLSA